MKLYKTFRMGGQPILQAGDFAAGFQPADFLRQRELAAGFAMQHLRGKPIPLERRHPEAFPCKPGFLSEYCAALLFHTVLNWDNFPELRFPQARDFFQRYHCQQRDREAVLLKTLGEEPLLLDVLVPVWELAGKTGLEEREQQRLFAQLGCGLLLAGKTLSAVSLTPQEAEQAYHRTAEHAGEEQQSGLSFPEEGDLQLPAREAPYRILLDREAAEARLQRDSSARIQPRKLTALPHPQGGADLPLVLEVYTSPEDPQPRQISIQPGDYRYLNCVGSIPVLVHPVVLPLKEEGALERRGDTLLKTGPAALGPWSMHCGGRDLVGFAVSRGDDIVLLYKTGADFSQCWNADRFLALPKQGVVEVRYQASGELYLLHQNGTVQSSWGDILYKGISCLDRIPV